MGIARVMRGQVLSLKEKEYVEAARAAGASPFRIITRHIIPNTIGTIMVDATLAVAAAIIAESTLSFLGFGVQPPNTSWGKMLSDAEGYVGTAEGLSPLLPGDRDLHHGARGELPRRRLARRVRPAVGSRMSGSVPLLSVEHLSVEFPTDDGVLHAVDDVSFSVMPQETLGIVGESGSGKTVTSMAVLGLLPSRARISGEVRFRGEDLRTMREKELEKIRGAKIAMVFQDALAALNPAYRSVRRSRRRSPSTNRSVATT